MKALICEMCGSNSLIKKDGFYQCESCGTKYDTEEAKKLLVTVTVDDSHRVANYLELAQQSRQTCNYTSAEEYCNKALELDVNSFEAWLLRAEIVAAQFDKDNNKLKESISCYKHAAEIAPSDADKAKATESLSSFEVSQAEILCSQYENTGSRDIADKIMLLMDCIEVGNVEYEEFVEGSVLSDKDVRQLSKWVSNSAARAWNRCIMPRFKDSPSVSVNAFFDDGQGALLLTERAITLDKNNDRRNLGLYENLLDMSESLMSPIVPASYKQVVMQRRKVWEPEANRLRTKLESTGYKLEEDKQWTKPKAKKNDGDGSGWISNRVGCLIVIIITILLFFSGGFIWG